MALFAVALLGLIFGISRVETGFNAVGVTAIAVGLLAGFAFVMQELRAQDPALDMQVFLGPVQRCRDRRGDVQHRARWIDGPAGLLPRHDSQRIA